MQKVASSLLVTKRKTSDYFVFQQKFLASRYWDAFTSVSFLFSYYFYSSMEHM